MAQSIVVATPQQFAITAAHVIAGQIAGAMAVRGNCSIALCGGSTPEPVYRALAKMPLQWSDIFVYFGDERAVPPNHPDSNYRMARQSLLELAGVADANVHRMEAERDDRDAAAEAYDDALPVRLDVLLLGVGPDGHVASLFPGRRSLSESRRRVLAVERPPLPLQPQVDRMTITPPVIAAARQVVVLVAGGAKAEIVRQALYGPEDSDHLPAQLARTGTWILDADAATQLQQGDR